MKPEFTYKPKWDWVVTKETDPEEKKTAAGIIIPGTVSETDKVKVVAVGPDSNLKKGDVILIRKGIGTTVEENNHRFRAFRDLADNVMMIC